MTPRVPPIKCQGIKTKLVPTLKSICPNDFDGVRIEPFCGSCVVALNLLPQKAILADTNKHIINFYRSIQSGAIDAVSVREHLQKEGALLEKYDTAHYLEVRQRFNTDFQCFRLSFSQSFLFQWLDAFQSERFI